ncbi:hypothetical protein [Halobacillus yeomjeoni]|uniref:Uncharacterized protein n=1 Tax=Halobacillus yeomjeoni TaxID=311194 RepID=A0A931HYC8_9BACI|nr:hypothetical protein [Halobacillus yeomjeoni]MBH0231640.1 hypothetical protein [Halobacillus yeomjeoni]
MPKRKPKRVKKENSSEIAEAFSKPSKYNTAFPPHSENEQIVDDSEGDALLDHYSDKDS